MPSNETLTEDGFPIGEIVVSNKPVEKRERDPGDREALVREELLELAGLDSAGDADKALAELYDGYGDREKRGKALRMYLVDRMSFEDIADRLGVPPRTVSMWSYNGRWDVALRREIQVEQEHSMLQLVRLRAERRARVAQEQLDAAVKVRETALGQLKDGETSVRSAADAMKSAADVEARILGISDSGALDKGDGEAAEDKGGKAPLVQIFQSGNGLPPIRVSGPAQ